MIGKIAVREVPPWLMRPDQLAEERQKFSDGYFGPRGEIFNNPHGAGYRLYGVEYDPEYGWLAFEYDETVFDRHDPWQHAEAAAAMLHGQPLPKNYYLLSREIAGQVFDSFLRRYGEKGYEELLDLPHVEAALQYTILGEIRYG